MGLRITLGHRVVPRCSGDHCRVILLLELLVVAAVQRVKLQLGAGVNHHEGTIAARLENGRHTCPLSPLVNFRAEGFILGVESAKLLRRQNAVLARTKDVRNGGFCDGDPGGPADASKIGKERG